jgi:hypothetical protein
VQQTIEAINAPVLTRISGTSATFSTHLVNSDEIAQNTNCAHGWVTVNGFPGSSGPGVDSSLAQLNVLLSLWESYEER